MAFSNFTKCFQKFISTSCHLNQTYSRNYSRWGHRRPRKIIYSDESQPRKDTDYAVINLNPDQIDEQRNSNNNAVTKKSNLFDFDKLDSETFPNKIKKKFKSVDKIKPLNSDQEKQKIIKHELRDTKIDNDGNLVYTKVHDNSKIIGTLMLNVKSRKRREKDGNILLEGKRLIRDGLLAGCQLQTLIFSRDKELAAIKDILPMNGVQLYKMTYRDMQMWSDLTTCPGIMGIFKAPDTEKQVPATNSLPLTVLCDNVRDPGNLGSILRVSASVGCHRMLLTKGCVELWDTKVLRSAAGAHFRLPIYKDLDWDDISAKIDENSTIFIAESNMENDDFVKRNSERKKLEDTLTHSIQVLPYYELDYVNCSSLVLIIGGETEGVSKEAYNLTMENSGIGLHIPLLNGVESLNTGTALGVIAFEIRRQFAMLKNKSNTNESIVNL